MRKLALLLGCIFLAGCTELHEDHVVLVGPDGDMVKVSVEYANTPEERRVGLMHRTSLPEQSGMLFMFDGEKDRAFWMKNTLIPLDIYYFNADRKMVSMHTMQPCTQDPCQTYPSGGWAKYALEVNAGFTEKHGITEAWHIEIPR